MEEELAHDVVEARELWEVAATVNALHEELASIYRAGGRDPRAIRILWREIEEREYWLRERGVRL